MIILILNAIVGVWQESNAEAALEALKNLQPNNARVKRDGDWDTLAADQLVVGDIVEVRKGDKPHKANRPPDPPHTHREG